MNVWGTGPFENEAGAAFATEVAQDGVFALREAFEVILDPDHVYIEAEEGHRALAAAEIVVAALGGETGRITDAGLRAWMAEADPDELEELRPDAAEALARIQEKDSELPGLWEDEGDADAWREDVDRLRRALEG